MVSREAGGKLVSRSRVAEWEEPRHPDGFANSKYPTSSHSATRNPHRDPLRRTADLGRLRRRRDDQLAARAARCADPGQRAVGGQQHGAHDRRDREHPSPASAVSSSVSLTPPRRSAGIASTGSARTTANTSTLTAVSAVTMAAGGSPARTSIRYCSAAPTAPPPGAIFASAPPASCDVITGRQRSARNATYWSAHTHASVAAWSAGHGGQRREREAPDVAPGAEHLDEAREHEIDRDTGDREPEDRPAEPARLALRRSISAATSVCASIACSTRSPSVSACGERGLRRR